MGHVLAVSSGEGRCNFSDIHNLPVHVSTSRALLSSLFLCIVGFGRGSEVRMTSSSLRLLSVGGDRLLPGQDGQCIRTFHDGRCLPICGAGDTTITGLMWRIILFSRPRHSCFNPTERVLAARHRSPAEDANVFRKVGADCNDTCSLFRDRCVYVEEPDGLCDSYWDRKQKVLMFRKEAKNSGGVPSMVHGQNVDAPVECKRR